VVVELYSQQIKKLNTDQLKERLKQKDKPYMLIDARDGESYYKGHIPGACSLFDGEIMSKAKDLDKNMSIIVYGPGSVSKTKLCDDAAAKFTSMGFKNVCAYENGLEGWADAGNRVDRSEKKMT
jgi:rhodanese-related sulfurtransferase